MPSTLHWFIDEPVLEQYSKHNPDVISISLFYLANCPLSSEIDALLDTSVALDCCAALKQIIRIRSLVAVGGIKVDLLKAVKNIHTFLSRRIKVVQESCQCKNTSSEKVPPAMFNDTPFDILAVVEILEDMAVLSKGSDSPFQNQ